MRRNLVKKRIEKNRHKRDESSHEDCREYLLEIPLEDNDKESIDDVMIATVKGHLKELSDLDDMILEWCLGKAEGAGVAEEAGKAEEGSLYGASGRSAAPTETARAAVQHRADTLEANTGKLKKTVRDKKGVVERSLKEFDFGARSVGAASPAPPPRDPTVTRRHKLL